MRMSNIAALLLATAMLCACVSEPPRYGRVITMKSGEQPPPADYPEAGTVWRLDENELKALSPAPYQEPPPPPRRPPPRTYYPPPPP
jgi:hypothetical protein